MQSFSFFLRKLFVYDKTRLLEKHMLCWNMLEVFQHTLTNNRILYNLLTYLKLLIYGKKCKKYEKFNTYTSYYTMEVVSTIP